MWSSCPWVRKIAWNRSPRPRMYVMSGIATSMPSIRSSGNMTPQSTAIAASGLEPRRGGEMLEHEAPYAPDELVAVHTRRRDRTAHDDLDVARGHPPGASRQDLVTVTHDHGDDRDSGVERHHEAALLEPQKRVAGRGTGTLGEDHDRDALAHPQLGRTQAPDRLRAVAPVDDDVAGSPERPAEHRDARQLDLGHPAELVLRQRSDHREDVELAAVVRHEDVGRLRVERGEPPRSHAHAAGQEVDPDPEPAESIRCPLVEQGDGDHAQRTDDRVEPDADQLEDRNQDHDPFLTPPPRTPPGLDRRRN